MGNVYVYPMGLEQVRSRFLAGRGLWRSVAMVLVVGLVFWSVEGKAQTLYRSRQNGNWNTTSTWQISTNGGSNWSNIVSNPPTNSNNSGITIRSPHTVTVTANVIIDQTTIDAGGQVTVNSGQTLTIANVTGTDLTVSGTVTNSGAINLNTNSSINFGDGGRYNHLQNQGTIPTATWNQNSTCDVQQWGTSSGNTITNLNQNYGNLTISYSQTGNTGFALLPGGGTFSIQGNFTMNTTGTGVRPLRLCSNNNAATFNVGGNFIVSNGTFELDDVNQNATLNITGDLIQDGGIFDLSSGNSTGTVYLAGNFNQTGGTIRESGNGSGVFIFNGNDSKDFTPGGTISGTINFTVNKNVSTAVVNLASDFTIDNQLTLTSGLFSLGSNSLTVSGTIFGGSSLSYIQTNGTGILQRTAVGSATFPVGNSSYNPATLSNTGSATLGVRVFDAVYADGLSGTVINSKVVNRTWDVTGTLGGTLSLTVQWNSGDEAGDFTRGACYVSHYTGGKWQGETAGAASGGNPYTRTRSGITSLSPFAVGSQGVLPIHLLSFTGKAQASTIELQWATATEQNNDYMAVERSADGKVFDEIGRVPGHGTTLEPQSYTLTDRRPLPGINYYRLRQVD
ncbi:MAG: hypothetical protein KDD02_25860, partial [Phaeodactylibacter sp.]|nr:hypothetical protein [Phaeodactylibacter sp.]